MLLGFNTCKPHVMSVEDKIEVFNKLGCKTIELFLGIFDYQQYLQKLDPDKLKGFEFVSLHAPTDSEFLYKKNDIKTQQRLEVLEECYKKYKFRFAVIHPEGVEDWEVFTEYSFPIAVENSDHRKPIGRTVASMKEIFSKVDASMVLDVNHCYVNDNTLALVDEMYNEFKDKIKEIHLSGFETLHDLLYETKQREIIQSIPDKNLPIIIESPVNSRQEIEKEYNYIKKYLI